MTLGFLLLTIGTAAIYTALKDMTMADLALGNPPPKPKPGILAGLAAAGNAQVAAGSADIDKTVSGVGSFDGRAVAKWMVPVLNKAKQNGWDGELSSGYRTPAYSEQLCQNMCHAPSCPGTCAGRSSNHSGKRFPGGAIDVENPASFQAAMNKMGNPLRNSLPQDRVHFSVSGR